MKNNRKRKSQAVGKARRTLYQDARATVWILEKRASSRGHKTPYRSYILT